MDINDKNAGPAGSLPETPDAPGKSEMHAKAKTRMQVVKKEEKVAKLRAFICSALAAADAGSPIGGFTLVARSSDSPVMLALISLASQLKEHGVRVEAILADAEGLADASRIAPELISDARHLQNRRLIDAHEQLVIDMRTIWLGDTMRRDPQRQDAFECHSSDCETTAAWGRTAFDRLWRLADPVSIANEDIAPEVSDNPQADTALAAQAAAPKVPAPASAGTRH
jgi:hypothetical protein